MHLPSRVLYRLHREIFGRLEDDGALPTDLGNNGWPVFVIMASTRLAFLAASTRPVPQHLLPTLLGLSLLASGVVELIRLNCALQLTISLVGQGRIAEPPAPAITGPAMDAELSGNTPRRTRETEQKRR